MTPEDVEALYDAHAPRLYALALRIAGDAAAAAAAVEEAFRRLWESGESGDDDFRTLVRLTRDSALDRRKSQTPAANVGMMRPTPAGLIEELFFGGLSLRDLAGRYGLGETDVRRLIREGMAGLRMRVAQQE